MTGLLDELREALVGIAVTHPHLGILETIDVFADVHTRLVDVDRWGETAPMCGEWCPGYGYGFCLPLSTLPNRKCRVPAVDAPVNEPCIWRKP
jgi:hypothetical protein